MSATALSKTGKKNISVIATEWSEQLRLKFKSCISHTYVITGNVRDMVDNELTLQNYLTRMFLQPNENGRQNFDMVVQYDRANGITFPVKGMEEKFIEILELNSEAKAIPGAAAIFAKTGQSKSALPRDVAGAFALIERLLKMERKSKIDNEDSYTLVLIDYAETLFPAGNFGQLNEGDRNSIIKILSWAKDARISARGNAIVMIADSAVRLHDTLVSSASRIEQIEILLPTPEERLSFINYLEAAGGLEFEDGFDKQGFAHLTAGLKKMNIEDIKLTAVELGNPVSVESVKQRKREIYRQEYQSVLTIVDPEHGFEVIGGMDWLKTYHIESILKPMLAGNTKAVPQGAMYVGPPGTGKSLFASALAYEAKMNMVELDIGKMLGSLVGESEHNMEKALLAIKSLFPVLVWIDEIDQAINRGSTGDSGVSNRLFKKLLEFMSDSSNRGKVLFVAATNRPDSLDPALKRRGRFDKIIPFLPPQSIDERAAIFPAIMTRYGYEYDKKIDFDALAIDAADWVGSDIEAASVKAYEIAQRNGRQRIEQADFARALQVIIPASQDVALWSKLALLETSDTELLPPQMRKEFDKARIAKDVKTLMNESVTLELEEHRKSRKSL